MGKITTSTAKQLLFVCTPALLTIAMLLVGKAESLNFSFVPYILFAFVMLLLIGISATKCRGLKIRLSPVIPVMVLFSVIVLLYCNNSPQYDQTLYYYKALISAQEFDFSPQSVLNLAWHDHPMIPYALYITAGQVIFGSYTAVIVQNLILSLIAIYCVYKLIIFYVGSTKKSIIFSALGSAVFALSPVFITNCLSLNSDFPILVFLPIFLCAITYNKKIVMFASAVCLLFSKLPGTALGTIIIVTLIFMELIHSIKNKSGILKLVKNRLCLIIPLLLTIIHSVFFLKIWGNSLLSSAGTSDVPNCFTFDLHYIAIRLVQFFIFQFNWILTAIILIFGIGLIMNRRKKISESMLFEIKPSTATLVVSFFAYLFYCLGYVTHTHIRYQSLSIFYLVMFATIIFCKFCNIYYIRYIVFGVASLAMLSSFFFNSDFVSNQIFASYDFSGNRLINTHAFTWEEPIHDISDSVVYNSKFTELNTLYQKIHKELEITSSDNIIHLNFSKWKIDFADSWKDGALSYNDELHERSVALYSESGYPMPNCYYVAEKNMVYDNFSEFENQYFIDEVASNPDLLPDEAIIILFPWQSDKFELFRFYTVEESVKIEHNGFDAICLKVSK